MLHTDLPVNTRAFTLRGVPAEYWKGTCDGAARIGIRPSAAATMAADLARTPYAWPGGYDRLAVTDDGGTLCAACCGRELESIAGSCPGDGWRIVGTFTTAELDESVCCDHCGESFGGWED